VIRKPTVLILGAGASAPYGYPLGASLVDQIVDMTREQTGGPYRVLVGDTGREQISSFNRRLLLSETSSIDDFLESNPAYRELGKLCIAAALTLLGPSNGRPPNAGHHWYRYLWQHLHEGAADSRGFKENSLRIISYNYDRSFERYFAGVLRHAYPDLAEAGPEAAEAVRAQALPVVHLHGSLGDAGDAVFTVSDRASLNQLGFYKQVASGIRIVHDDRPTEEYSKAHEWLHEAEVICFLGFGYHPTNVKRLAVLDQIRGRSGVFVGGTAWGLEEAEVVRAESLLAVGGPYHYLRPEVDALMYLRKYAPLG
jgi:hypothetical protein